MLKYIRLKLATSSNIVLLCIAIITDLSLDLFAPYMNLAYNHAYFSGILASAR